MKFFLKCGEAAIVCDKVQYKEAGTMARFMLRAHILICRPCRGYSEQNVKLTKTIRSAKLSALCPERKQLLKKRIREELDKERLL
ncbi:hypothetical protein AEQU2_00712 [Aequorivita lipolytica]|uniref:Glycine dehydrogenase n=1 Tax=Aequorivita lipolytica TaxID=153267 RepID=A0A5C6YSC9_9FLAO|nr:hypothetical protein ESV24_05740 [Aequorivita lipolytica]SRX50241.1 hypothetical protein AEQU2_00712 [Aequorivita lipolytica]